MNAVQEKCLELLKEFDGICRENGLMYCLSPRLAAEGILYGGFGPNSFEPEVYMPVDDANAFIKIIENSQDETRSVEYMGNSKNYLDFSVRYVNEETTLINLNRGTDYSHYGINISIKMIRKPVENKWAAFLEAGWECNGYRFFRKFRASYLAAFAVVRVMMLAGRSGLAKRLFRKFSAVYGGAAKGNETFVRLFKKQRNFFSCGMFDEVQLVSYEDMQLPVPAELETYLVDYFGPGWQEVVLNRTVDPAKWVQMADVPYGEYLKRLEETGQPIKEVFREQRKSFLSGIFAFRHLKAKNKAWIVACRSGDRLRFYEEFQSKKEKINNLHMNKAYDELDEIFAEHERKVKYYLKNNLGLCVSQEIMDLQCELLINRGEEDVVKQWKQLVPEEHKKPINLAE